MHVTKRDGTTEEFDERKLRTSLRAAHTTEKDIDEIVAHIKDELTPGMSTEVIYAHAFNLLKKRADATAARYTLRQALADLGPTGYPFEHFVARLFEAQGYATEVGTVLAGKCITHEVDVVARKDGHVVIVEAKFHNRRGISSPAKTALYVHARFQDLRQNSYDHVSQNGESVRHLLVTNTKFSEDAVQFGECVGMEMIGWDYPRTDNLQDLIEDAHLEPVTTLTTLSGSEKKHLLEQGIVLCKSLRDRTDELQALGVSGKKLERVLTEVDQLCHPS